MRPPAAPWSVLILAASCGGRIGSSPDAAALADAVSDDTAVAASGLGYCPGWEPPAGPAAPCLTNADCPKDSQYDLFCVSVSRPRAPICGGALFPPVCTGDGGCAASEVCHIDTGCGRNTCEPACTPQSCPVTQTCTDGFCVPKRCDQPGAAVCSEGWTCRPGPETQATSGCAPDSCREKYRCPTPLDCNPTDRHADPHGCAWRQCKRSADCACGSCVLGQCEPAPGRCEADLRPP